MSTLRVGIAGATGYLGQETLRILANHPHVEVAALASSSHVGRTLGDAVPAFAEAFPDAPAFTPVEAESFRECDVALLATPHGVAKALAPDLLALGCKVIDLSGDHRIADAESALGHYGGHGAAQAHAVYGLPEVARDAVRGASLVANPGCYPTAATLAALPLVRAGLVQGPVVVDAKSGVSGAGKSPREDLHFSEMDGAFRAYAVGSHRHAPEIAQNIGLPVVFTPHLVPMSRGILATVYLTAKGPALSAGELADLYAKAYADEPFVRVVPFEPDVKLVQRTNLCHVRPHAASHGVYVVTAAIDNLVKGGAGQAVQNLNILGGFPEKTALPVIGGGA